jgi:hypothetical protein
LFSFLPLISPLDIMPKTIDYPRTSYTSAWEVAEVVDDTGGKCAIETAARKLNRKVSGSFKAIIGSAVKFGLLTSKREFLTTTNLFRRIKHAYDKQEERVFHREAFLHPPLFTQICRKFRNRELPVHMLDVMLLREFGVEEINAQGVAKAFIDGARMVAILDEQNIIADIDQLDAQQGPRKELSTSEMPLNLFKGTAAPAAPTQLQERPPVAPASTLPPDSISTAPGFVPPSRTTDAVSSLFGLDTEDLDEEEDALPGPNDNQSAGFVPQGSAATNHYPPAPAAISQPAASVSQAPASAASYVPPVAPLPAGRPAAQPSGTGEALSFTIQINGPGLDTQLVIQDPEDLVLVSALLDKMRRQLTR